MPFLWPAGVLKARTNTKNTYPEQYYIYVCICFGLELSKPQTSFQNSFSNTKHFSTCFSDKLSYDGVKHSGGTNSLQFVFPQVAAF